MRLIVGFAALSLALAAALVISGVFEPGTGRSGPSSVSSAPPVAPRGVESTGNEPPSAPGARSEPPDLPVTDPDVAALLEAAPGAPAVASRTAGAEAAEGESATATPERTVKAAIEILEQSYEDPSDEALKRRVLARDLLIGVGARSVPLLLEAGAKSSPTFQTEVQSVVAEIGTDALQELVQGLRHSDPAVRKLAAESLGQMGSDAAPAVPELLRASVRDGNDLAVGLAEVRAIVRVGEPAIPTLAAALTDPDPAMRFRAVWLLGEIGPAAAPVAPALEPLLEDENIAIRKQVEVALDRIGAGS